MRKVVISSAEGADIVAVIDHPPVKTGKLAILCPGYLDSKDYENLSTLALELVQKGYTAVRFDPSEVWKEGADIEDYTITEYLNDIRRTFDYMRADGNYSRVLLGGYGLGGIVSVFYAARDERISEILVILPAHIKNFYSIESPARKYDLAEEIKKVHVPITFIAGEADAVTKLDDVKEIFSRAKEPKKLIVVKDAIDDYRRNPADIEKVRVRIVEEIW